MDLPLETECVVSGTLNFILHVSRVAGTSPVNFKRVSGGWRIRVSLCSYVYCCVVQLILMVGMGIFIDRDEVEDGFEKSHNTGFMRIIIIIYFVTHLMTGTAITVTAVDRMRRMIDCRARLQWINAEIDGLLRPCKSNERTMFLIVIASLVLGYFVVSIQYGIYIWDLSAHDTVTFASCALIALYLGISQIHIYSIQFWMVIMELVFTQKRMNNCLRSVLQELKDDVPQSFSFDHVNEETESNEGIPIPNHVISCGNDPFPVLIKRRTHDGAKIDPATLDRLIQIYCSVCGIIRQLNDSNGLALLMVLLFIYVYLLTAPYWAVTILFRMHSTVPVARSIALLIRCLLYIIILAMTVDACHRSHTQLSTTRRLIRQMRRYTRREATEVSAKLKLFYRHIQLNPVRFAPLKLLTFNRSILIMVWSNVITYLSVVMNL